MRLEIKVMLALLIESSEIQIFFFLCRKMNYLPFKTEKAPLLI